MVTLNINGHDHSVDVPNDTPLLWVIREHLQMTGTKIRMRRRSMWRLHSSSQRRRRALLPDRRVAGLGQEDHNDRRPRSQG